MRATYKGTISPPGRGGFTLTAASTNSTQMTNNINLNEKDQGITPDSDLSKVCFAPDAVRQNHESAFLKLPLELRRMIYSSIFHGTDGSNKYNDAQLHVCKRPHVYPPLRISKRPIWEIDLETSFPGSIEICGVN